MLFYDFEFNLLLIEPKVISWRFTKYFNEIGTFEAHLPVSSKATKLVLENDFLVLEIFGEFAIITGKQVADELIIYGRTCNWLFSKRVVLPFRSTGKLTGDFAKSLFENAYSSCENVVFGTMNQGENHTFFSSTPRLLSDSVFEALKIDNLGNEFVFDKAQKKWVFNILKGEDRLLMISEANKNATHTEIIENISDYANLCYYESGSEFLFSGGDETGLYRFETYLLSGGVEDAKSELLKLKKESTTEVTSTGPVYKKDYFLGDTVRVQIIKNDYKVTKRLRIKGVELVSKPGGYTEKPIFEEV